MGNAARKYIQSIHRAGYNVSIRPIYNIYDAYPEQEIDNEIISLEKNFSKKYDICIQHCYPHQVVYSNKFDQISGIIHLESMGYGADISSYLSRLDNIIVGSFFVKESLSKSGIATDRIFIVPEPIDVSVINSFRHHSPKHISSEYSFYTIGDFSERKNIESIVLAFSVLSTEFDNIALTVKTNRKPGCSLEDYMIRDSIESVNSIFPISEKIRKRAKIILGYTEYKNILSLHNMSDCYINLCSGDSFGYSTLEAMCFDNNVITTSGIGAQELLGKYNNLIVESSNAVCRESHKECHIYNSIYNTWHQPSLEDLLIKMKMAITENYIDKTKRIIDQREFIKRFDMIEISKAFKEIFE